MITPGAPASPETLRRHGSPYRQPPTSEAEPSTRFVVIDGTPTVSKEVGDD